MDYITVHINRLFIRRVLVVLSIVAAGLCGYKVGYKKGMTDTLNYIEQMLMGGSSSREDGEPAPMGGSSFYKNFTANPVAIL